MTESDGSDESHSGSRSDRAGRFSDIASEFSDEFGVRSEDGPGAGHESESPDTDTDADAGARATESADDAGSWEWIGDDDSGVATDASERSNRADRLWNDGPADDDTTEDAATDDDTTRDAATDDDTTRDAATDDDTTRDAATDDDTTRDAAIDDDLTENAATDRDPARGGPTGGGADRTAADTTRAEPNASPDERTEATSDRIWNEGAVTGEPSATTETAGPPSGGGVSTDPPTAGVPEASDASGFAEDESVLDGDRFDRGTNVLIQSESRAERTRDGCQELLFGRESDRDPDVLLVRYQPMDGDRLEGIAAKAHRVHLISVGYAQSVPPAADGTVEVTQINNPNDITRLGIVVSGITQEWSTDDREIRVCYDSLNVLLNYRDVKNAFRFLHVFLSTFTKTDAVAHFHADPLEGDPQAINTLKPLFDEVVSMDSTGTYVE